MRIESGKNSTEAKFCKGFHPTFDSGSKFCHLLDLLTRYFLSGAPITLLDEAYFKGALFSKLVTIQKIIPYQETQVRLITYRTGRLKPYKLERINRQTWV